MEACRCSPDLSLEDENVRSFSAAPPQAGHGSQVYGPTCERSARLLRFTEADAPSSWFNDSYQALEGIR